MEEVRLKYLLQIYEQIILKPSIELIDINNLIDSYEKGKPIGIINYQKNLIPLKNTKIKCLTCERNGTYFYKKNNNEIICCWVCAHKLS
jgi:hypothetical protein